MVRDINHNGTFDNGEAKVYGETAIPCGRYYVTFHKTSLDIGSKARDGVIPYVHDVPFFKHIRIHPGDNVALFFGCEKGMRHALQMGKHLVFHIENDAL